MWALTYTGLISSLNLDNLPARKARNMGYYQFTYAPQVLNQPGGKEISSRMQGGYINIEIKPKGR